MKEGQNILKVISEYQLREAELKLNNNQLRDLNLALQMAEEKSAILNAIISSSGDAIISKNLDGIVTSWNPSAERIFGYSASEIIGQSISILIPQDRLKEEVNILNKLKQGIRIDLFETQRLTKNGQLIDVSLTISPILDQFGNITGLSKIAKDLTVERNEERISNVLVAIIDSSDDAIVSKNLDGIITSWNHSAERIFGYSAHEIIGKSILTIIPPDRYEEEPKILAQLRQGIRVDHFETRRLRKDGTLVDVSLTISPIKDHHNNVIGLSKIARDISDKKREEQRKNEFIGFVSHELKTPLTSLTSYIQVALQKAEKIGDDFTIKALSRAEIQTRKMAKMITDFLNVPRLENGNIKLNIATFDVVALIKEIIVDAQVISVKHAIYYSGNEQVYISADKEKIGLVLNNLLSNAQKYSPKGGDITIFCKEEANLCKISIQDKGIGIAKDEQQRLFEKFYRVSNDKTQQISGFGIGLYLVNTILNLHGSQILVDSVEEEGSTFSFELNSIL
ncbi:PAS domain S-box protein [Pedobacter nototheniae]|uniref:PAS domain S-box protein n=1 Tax=Pedobacter nototheniae TaxID=2488994 RepID=UPI0010400758|nr:PAS domain S-box protein [Pedobacter nototheniae]